MLMSQQRHCGMSRQRSTLYGQHHRSAHDMTRHLIAAVFALLLSTSVTHAGNLFPPQNLNGPVSNPCPNNQVLKWTGDGVSCADPTPGVTVMCPAGSLLRGIKNGQPVCSTCRVCVQVVDAGGGTPGTTKCTPYGSGTSEYSFDPDRYDPDGVRVSFDCVDK